MTAAALALAFDEKRLATARARCDLWGGALRVLEGDDGRPQIICTRWALTRAFGDLNELDEWLDRVTGAKR